MTKYTKRVLSLLMIAILALGILTGCGAASNTGDAKGEKADGASAGSTATVILVDEDETEYTLELKLDGEVSIREAMIQNELVPEEEYAAMTFETIDGHVAKMEDGVLWLPCDADGNQLMAGTGFAIDDNTVKPGDTIKFIYTVAPNFDD